MKKALLVGVNKYQTPGMDLRGCVNDVHNMWQCIVNKFGFDPDQVRVLTDNRATTKAIIRRLNWMVTNLQPGDELLFHFSGHGSFIRDRNGDELNDHKDELLCPYDMDWDNPFTDDILARIFSRVPVDARLVFIADCCHSGTMDRGIPQNPHEVLAKKIDPPLDIMLRSEGRRNMTTSGLGIIGNRSHNNVDIREQRHTMISGCMEHQTSADAYLDGQYQGALTSSLLKAISQNPQASIADLHQETLKILHNGRFTQVPQLTTNQKNLGNPLF